jgi:hypothetical protein
VAVIRQICPRCLETVEMPDAAAGTAALCPKCREPIAVPTAYTPSVDPTAGPAAPPPGYSPSPDPYQERPAVSSPSSEAITLDRVDRPTPPPGPATPPPGPAPQLWPSLGRTSAPASRAGYARSLALVLTPQGLAWVPAVCLTLVFALAFFDWAGSYPGGTRLYSQTAWESMLGRYTTGGMTEKVLADHAEIDARVRFSFWLFLAMPLLVVTLLLVWAERLLLRNVEPDRVPSELEKVWPHRFTILAGAVGAVLLLILLQSALGFGLESAVRGYVNSTFELQAAAADTPAKKQEVAVTKAKMLHGYALQVTTARQLAIAALVVAVAALLGRWWLDRRGPQALPPRVLVQY